MHGHIHWCIDVCIFASVHQHVRPCSCTARCMSVNVCNNMCTCASRCVFTDVACSSDKSFIRIPKGLRFSFPLFSNPHWHCVQLCQVVAKQMAHMLTVPERKLVPMFSTATSQIGRAGLVEELKRIPGAPDPVLLETLPMGVAFHHAGVPLATFPSFCLCLALT